MPTSLVPIQRALISVSDKTGVVELARFLAGRGVKLLSTGGTARTLDEAGIAVTEVSAHTGFPEILDGRVKTLHPKIHGGLMARRDLATHREAMTDYGIQPIDLLVASLYPFEETVARGGDAESCIENIDVGGPAMIRAAAKNHAFVTVVTDTADYDAVREDMELHAGSTSLTLRRRLAAAAYARTAAYDAAIAAWFAQVQGEPFARNVAIAGKLKLKLRYGENPHQAAALYLTAERRPGAASAEVLQGKELSYNNLVDANAAFELVAEFTEPAAVVVKHANPCGVAVAERLEEAVAAARAADPLSAFGGVVALNRPLDAAAAGAIAGQFYEVVIAPEATAEARDVLAAKKNLRLLVTGAMPDAAGPCLTGRSIAGGFLLAERDNRLPGELTVVTQRAPTAAEEADLRFAMAVAKHVASNAIVLARGRATVGIGAGQMSRVDSVKAAVRKAAEMAEAAGEGQGRAVGAVLASDGFFPFPDGVEAAAAAGVTAVIQPGGSMRDAEVTAAADRAGIAMVTTGLRHFRH